MIKKLLLPIVMLLSMRLSAQNLVNNGSFEILVKQDDLYGKKAVKDWTMHGFYNCNSNNTNFYNNFMGKDRRCDPTYYPYLDGKTKMCLGLVGGHRVQNYGGSYIFTTLTTSLKMSKLYKVEANFYFPSVQIVDSLLYKHIGFTMTTSSPVTYFHFRDWKFTNDSMVFDRWFKKTWYIRPTCNNLSVFTIGLSSDANWPIYGPEEDLTNHGSEIYVDKVSIEEISETSLDSAKIVAVPFCRCKTAEAFPKKSVVVNRSLFFPTNSAVLDTVAMQLLDTFAHQCKVEPMAVFDITGFTDDDGSNHLALSKERVDQVIQYLTTVHKINPIRFLTTFAGNVQKSFDNERIKKENRRVDLVKSKLQLDQVLYKKVLTTSSKDSAFWYLNKWLSKTKTKFHLYALLDPRLDSLRAHKKWLIFEDQVKSQYKTLKKPQEAFWLDSMYVEDQKYRTSEAFFGSLADWYDSSDSTCFAFPKLTNEQWVRLDSINYAAMVRFIDQKGWPNQSEVGDRPSRAAFFIVDHYFDTLSFKKYLPLLEQKCLEGEAEWRDFAIMTDRLEKTCGRLQKYCEQYTLDPSGSNRYILAPYDSEEAVNARRRKIGLQPIRNFNNSFTVKISHLK